MQSTGQVYSTHQRTGRSDHLRPLRPHQTRPHRHQCKPRLRSALRRRRRLERVISGLFQYSFERLIVYLALQSCHAVRELQTRQVHRHQGQNTQRFHGQRRRRPQTGRSHHLRRFLFLTFTTLPGDISFPRKTHPKKHWQVHHNHEVLGHTSLAGKNENWASYRSGY